MVISSSGRSIRPSSIIRCACRILTRRTLARFLQIESQSSSLDEGRPRPTGLGHRADVRFSGGERLDFSCSHSENLFAMGVMCEGRIGIDLEILRPENVPALADCRELSA